MVQRLVRSGDPALLAPLLLVAIVFSPRPAVATVPVAVATLGLSALLSWREVGGWPLVAGLVLVGVGVSIIASGQSANLGWFAFTLIAGSVALLTGVRQTVTVVALLFALLVGQWLAEPDEPGWFAWMGGTVFAALVCAWARSQQVLLDRLRAAQSQLADRARAEERMRLAGEMHDVIGHSLAVSLLHVNSARLALDEDVDTARAALEEAERLTRNSLEEARVAVGLLHAGERGDTNPTPDASDVPELVDSFSRAGLAVDLAVDGDLAELGPTRGLAVYRIVQESLTNVTRHAPGTRATVRIVAASPRTTITVRNDGPPGRRAPNGTGLLTMQTRAESVGGAVVAGPGDQGWVLDAWLPS